MLERAFPINSQVDSFLRFLAYPESGVSVWYHQPSQVGQLQNVMSTIQPFKHTWGDLRMAAVLAFRACGGAIRRGTYRLRGRKQ